MSSKLSLVNKYFIFAKNLVIRGVSILNTVLEVNFFFSNIHVSLVVVVLYFISFEFLLSPILKIPNGVSYVFVSRSWKYFSLLAMSSSWIFLAILRFKKSGKLAFNNSKEKIYSGDFFLLLLPLTPVVQYILNNQDILSPLGSLYVFIFFMLFSGIYIFVIPAFLSFVGSTRTLIFLGLAFVFTITSMASLSNIYEWFDKGSIKIQLMFMGGVFLATWFLNSLNDKKILRVLIAVVFVSNSVMQLLAQDIWKDRTSLPVAENKLLSLIEERVPAVTPNIYLLVYDAYVSNETMLAYGINNSSQEEYLEELGFELYPHTYSVGHKSIKTMSRVLNASTDFYGNSRRAVSGDGIIQKTLKSFGYETYGLFPWDWYFRGNNASTYDFSTPEYISSPDILLQAILMGEFRFDFGFDKLSRKQFVETKQGIFESVSGNQVFIYMHSNLPGHSQNSGVCRPDETNRFITKLLNANLEMQQDIKTIIENDPESIIIVAGDHGPYLTKNCLGLEGYDISEISRLDIQDRFGTFLAIRWPTDNFAKFDDITVLQDIFPAVFAYLLNDQRILESKIESSILEIGTISGASVQNGIIFGGINDGEPLFIADK